MPINVPAITWTEQADPTSPIASYAYSLSAADDISFGLNAERFGIVTRPRFVSVDNTRNTGSVTVRMYNASYTILGSQAQTVPIQSKTDKLDIIGANGTLGVTFFLNEPYAAGVNYSELLAESGGASDSVFSANLRVGTGASRQYNTGINFQIGSGLFWSRCRDTAFATTVYDTIRGEFIRMAFSGSAAAQQVELQGLTAFLSNGVSFGTLIETNNVNSNYVDFSLKKASGFFDILTYVGDGATLRSIPHGLSADPGLIIVKPLSITGSVNDWMVWHTNLTDTKDYYLAYNLANSEMFNSQVFRQSPTQTEFFVGTNANVAGAQYIVYLFANDPGAGSRSRTGVYTGNGAVSGPVVALGKRPLYVLVKRLPTAGNWVFSDYARGTGVHSSINSAGLEVAATLFDFTPTGFQVVTNDAAVNANLSRYIWHAILEP